MLEKMKVHNFFTEIAFIPFNYKRSNPKTTRLFAANSDYYAICVHGCNHTGNEFGGSGYKELSDLSSTALWRMEQHKRITGLPYDPVMVFPQGQFSSTAMKVIKDQGYFAAFNSNIRAVDTPFEPFAIEYQYFSTKMYHNFPLFLRLNPKNKSHFVDAVASGHPIVIDTHHSDFRNGYKAITDLVDWINSFGNIKWTSLLNIAEHYSGKKYVNCANAVNSSPSHPCPSGKTILRRFLSETRDNYIETNNFLADAYRTLRMVIQKRRLRATR
ncbi:MAG: hypothetical protein AB7S77_12930 [Desulfatirhabdiaceae bacterium]